MKILFICSGNTCRSPMAQVLFKKRYPHHESLSAGMSARQVCLAHVLAQQAMEKRGLSLKEHRSQTLTAEMIATCDVILTMEEKQAALLTLAYRGQRDKIHSIKGFVGEKGDVKDPYGGTAEEYEACAKELEALIEKMGSVM